MCLIYRCCKFVLSTMSEVAHWRLFRNLSIFAVPVCRRHNVSKFVDSLYLRRIFLTNFSPLLPLRLRFVHIPFFITFKYSNLDYIISLIGTFFNIIKAEIQSLIASICPASNTYLGRDGIITSNRQAPYINSPITLICCSLFIQTPARWSG